MTYTILGTGAIGGYYGAKLQKGGNQVDFLARSDFKHIQEEGLKIDSVDGDFTLEKVNVYASVQEMPKSDVILVTMKTTVNGKLSELLAPLVKEGTIIFVLQNGLGMEMEIEKNFPKTILLGGMCFICSQKIGPGHIAHLDQGYITAAPLHKRDLFHLEDILEDFTRSGIKMNIHEDLQESRWRKLLWNIPFNGLTVILNTDTEGIMNNTHSTALARRLMEEVLVGASACGCEIDRDSIDHMIDVTRDMAPYEPSMKLDYNFKRQMEIEYMYRRPLDAAEKQGVALPCIKMLIDQLSFMERESI